MLGHWNFFLDIKAIIANYVRVERSAHCSKSAYNLTHVATEATSFATVKTDRRCRSDRKRSNENIALEDLWVVNIIASLEGSTARWTCIDGIRLTRSMRDVKYRIRRSASPAVPKKTFYYPKVIDRDYIEQRMVDKYQQRLFGRKDHPRRSDGFCLFQRHAPLIILHTVFVSTADIDSGQLKFLWRWLCVMQ